MAKMAGNLDTIIADFVHQVRAFVLKEASQALERMPDAQKKIDGLLRRRRRSTESELRASILDEASRAQRGRTMSYLTRLCGPTESGKVKLLVSALVKSGKLQKVGKNRASRYRIPNRQSK